MRIFPITALVATPTTNLSTLLAVSSMLANVPKDCCCSVVTAVHRTREAVRGRHTHVHWQTMIIVIIIISIEGCWSERRQNWIRRSCSDGAVCVCGLGSGVGVSCAASKLFPPLRTWRPLRTESFSYIIFPSLVFVQSLILFIFDEPLRSLSIWQQRQRSTTSHHRPPSRLAAVATTIILPLLTAASPVQPRAAAAAPLPNEISCPSLSFDFSYVLLFACWCCGACAMSSCWTTIVEASKRPGQLGPQQHWTTRRPCQPAALPSQLVNGAALSDAVAISFIWLGWATVLCESSVWVRCVASLACPVWPSSMTASAARQFCELAFMWVYVQISMWRWGSVGLSLPPLLLPADGQRVKERALADERRGGQKSRQAGKNLS